MYGGVKVKCPKCNAILSEGANFCNECGADIYGDGYLKKENKSTNNITDDSLILHQRILEENVTSKTKIVMSVLFTAIILILIGIILYLFWDRSSDDNVNNQSDLNNQNVTTTVSATEKIVNETIEETVEEKTDKKVKVPDVAGYEYSSALQRLQNENLKISYISEYSDNIPENYIIRQSPSSGTEVNEGDTVSLVVSKGKYVEIDSSHYNVNNNVENRTEKPVFISISVSSTLAPDNEANYECTNMLYDNGSCWSEGVDGVGIGESITFSSNTTQYISGMSIKNGLCKTEGLFKKNGRVAKMRFEFSNGEVIYKYLSDVRSLQNLSFGKTIPTTYVKMTIEEVYRGTQYEDTCITLLMPY